jgi:hypothetical protein
MNQAHDISMAMELFKVVASIYPKVWKFLRSFGASMPKDQAFLTRFLQASSMFGLIRQALSVWRQ